MQSKLKEALYGPVEALLQATNDETWPSIRKLFKRETETVVAECSAALSGFDMKEQSKMDFSSKLENYAIDLVEKVAKEEAGRVLYLMKERYLLIFVTRFIIRGGNFDLFTYEWVKLGCVFITIVSKYKIDKIIIILILSKSHQ
ncbi:hypothetical protein Hanom_Chr10g00883041 [Helianthus anomalus]